MALLADARVLGACGASSDRRGPLASDLVGSRGYSRLGYGRPPPPLPRRPSRIRRLGSIMYRAMVAVGLGPASSCGRGSRRLARPPSFAAMIAAAIYAWSVRWLPGPEFRHRGSVRGARPRGGPAPLSAPPRARRHRSAAAFAAAHGLRLTARELPLGASAAAYFAGFTLTTGGPSWRSAWPIGRGAGAVRPCRLWPAPGVRSGAGDRGGGVHVG